MTWVCNDLFEALEASGGRHSVGCGTSKSCLCCRSPPTCSCQYIWTHRFPDPWWWIAGLHPERAFHCLKTWIASQGNHKVSRKGLVILNWIAIDLLRRYLLFWSEKGKTVDLMFFCCLIPRFSNQFLRGHSEKWPALQKTTVGARQEVRYGSQGLFIWGILESWFPVFNSLCLGLGLTDQNLDATGSNLVVRHPLAFLFAVYTWIWICQLGGGLPPRGGSFQQAQNCTALQCCYLFLIFAVPCRNT